MDTITINRYYNFYNYPQRLSREEYYHIKKYIDGLTLEDTEKIRKLASSEVSEVWYV